MKVNRRIKTTGQLCSAVTQQECFMNSVVEHGVFVLDNICFLNCSQCLFKLNMLICFFRFHVKFLIFV